MMRSLLVWLEKMKKAGHVIMFTDDIGPPIILRAPFCFSLGLADTSTSSGYAKLVANYLTFLT